MNDILTRTGSCKREQVGAARGRVPLAARRSLCKVVMSESGITSARELARLRSRGVEAFLMGEAHPDFDHPGQGLRSLRAAMPHLKESS